MHKDTETGRFQKTFDCIGKKFGRLTVIENLGCKDGKNQQVRCVCECGKITTPQMGALKTGGTKSCGCWKLEVDTKRMKSLTPEQRLKAKLALPRGAKHRCWKGGISHRSGGYIELLLPNHPRAKKSGYIPEHVVVMEQHIGRYVLRSESVHHINGVRNDNRIENLELWDKAQHPPGQRHSDKMKWHMSELLKKCDRKTLVEFCSEVMK